MTQQTASGGEAAATWASEPQNDNAGRWSSSAANQTLRSGDRSQIMPTSSSPRFDVEEATEA